MLHTSPAEINKLFLKVLITLLILTVVTVGASRIDFGAFNFVIAMLIASVKALLVAGIFMHLKYEEPLLWMYAAIPVVILFFLLAGIFIDNPYRTDGRSHIPAALHVEKKPAAAHH
jgi:cytochrome c oxidase subunit IV